MLFPARNRVPTQKLLDACTRVNLTPQRSGSNNMSWKFNRDFVKLWFMLTGKWANTLQMMTLHLCFLSVRGFVNGNSHWRKHKLFLQTLETTCCLISLTLSMVLTLMVLQRGANKMTNYNAVQCYCRHVLGGTESNFIIFLDLPYQSSTSVFQYVKTHSVTHLARQNTCTQLTWSL